MNYYCKVSGEKPDRNGFWSGPNNVSVPSASSVHPPSLFVLLEQVYTYLPQVV